MARQPHRQSEQCSQGLPARLRSDGSGGGGVWNGGPHPKPVSSMPPGGEERRHRRPVRAAAQAAASGMRGTASGGAGPRQARRRATANPAAQAAAGGPQGWDCLPHTCLQLVFDSLELRDLAAAASVCQTWRYEASLDSRWRAFWQRSVSDLGLWRWAKADGERRVARGLCTPEHPPRVALRLPPACCSGHTPIRARRAGGYRQQLRAKHLVRRGDCVASVFPFNRRDGPVSEVLFFDGGPRDDDKRILTVQVGSRGNATPPPVLHSSASLGRAPPARLLPSRPHLTPSRRLLCAPGPFPSTAAPKGGRPQRAAARQLPQGVERVCAAGAAPPSGGPRHAEAPSAGGRPPLRVAHRRRRRGARGEGRGGRGGCLARGEDRQPAQHADTCTLLAAETRAWNRGLAPAPPLLSHLPTQSHPTTQQVSADAGDPGVVAEAARWAEHPAIVASVLEPGAPALRDVPMAATFGR